VIRAASAPPAISGDLTRRADACLNVMAM